MRTIAHSLLLRYALTISGIVVEHNRNFPVVKVQGRAREQNKKHS